MPMVQIPDTLYQKLSHVAVRRNSTVDELAQVAITIYLSNLLDRKNDTENASLATESTLDSGLDDEFEKGVDAEIRAYHKLHPSLLQQHAGEFVAIYDQQLVDHDKNELALYQRIREIYPEKFVLMRQVEEAPEQELHFRST